MSEPTINGIKSLLDDRKQTHGHFPDMADIAQLYKLNARSSLRWDSLKPFEREALDMIFHKVARILCGNPHHLDHWEDLAGYALRCAEELRLRQGAIMTPE